MNEFTRETPKSGIRARCRPGEVCREHSVNPENVALGRRLLASEDLYARLAETFRTLANPTRAKIVYSLLHQELCTCDLAAIVGLSEPAVSQHLRRLRALRVVRHRRAGKMVYYSLDDDHIRTLISVALGHHLHAEPAGVWAGHGDHGDEEVREYGT